MPFLWENENGLIRNSRFHSEKSSALIWANKIFEDQINEMTERVRRFWDNYLFAKNEKHGPKGCFSSMLKISISNPFPSNMSKISFFSNQTEWSSIPPQKVFNWFDSLYECFEAKYVLPANLISSSSENCAGSFFLKPDL